MKHWALPLIGRPWAPDGDGPDRFSCWGLVRWKFRTRDGIDMPAVRLGDFGDAENVAAIKEAAAAGGWRPSKLPPQDDDIVLMRDFIGRRHVGLMVSSRRGLLLLHADGYLTERGPVGSVKAQPLAEVLIEGYRELEIWRRP